MSPPPPYPRIEHLVGGRGTRDDLVLGEADRQALLGGPVILEEKLDGANVVLWLDRYEIKVALRSGEGASDRAGQLGPLRAWIAEHADALRTLLADDTVAYAEWLLLTHSVPYDRLPAYLVVLDLWHAGSGFLPVGERDGRCQAAGIPPVPTVWRGTPRTIDEVERHFGMSAFGSGPVEGLVVRSADGRPPRIAKILRPGFDRIDDDAWRSGRPRNQLIDRDASWH